MPTLVRTNQTKADLLQRKLEINSELRELRNRYDKPGVVEVPGDRQRVDDLIERHTHLGMLGVSGINAITYTDATPRGLSGVGLSSVVRDVS